jgi:dipeptidyl aminopeptidase/acylaminoacyl peptidase
MVLASVLGIVVGLAGGQATRSDYRRAASLKVLTAGKVFKSSVAPHWFADNTRFWHRNDLRDGGREFIVVDAIKGVRERAFDHEKAAAALSKATGRKHTAASLQIERIEFLKGGAIRLDFKGESWEYSPKTARVTRVNRAPGGKNRSAANRGAKKRPRQKAEKPYARPTVFARDRNLYIRTKGDDEARALTRDGTQANPYTGHVAWSPDSKKFVAFRTTKAQKRLLHLIESSPADQLQPKLHSYTYLKPGDAIAATQPHLFDAVAGKEIPLDRKLFSNPYQLNSLRWSRDSKEFTFYYNQRGHQVVRIVGVDAKTGRTRAVINEETKTFFDYANKQYVNYLDETGEIIWASERDGWNHLYLYDARTGKVKNQITKGPWVIRRVMRVDRKERRIWFRAGGIRPGQDPYYIHYGRVNFDGSGLTLLTEGDGTHEIKYSPNRRFFIDAWSRVDAPPVTELRRASDGKLICPLETADISALLETGWKTPIPFSAKGRDGKTDIYGVIIRPTNFDPKKKYPVIENIYAGPQGSYTPKRFTVWHKAWPVAELGFIIVQIDGMGTSNRSKAFHDVCAKNLADAGFPDRIAWIKAAAEKYPWMDITRVGVFGRSAGGQNAARGVLDYPDFYKVAVAYAGCHDNRMDKIWWNELWMGWPVGPHYAASSNATVAHKLRGKLMLIVGELDRNVDPSSTMQLAGALIKADKDFDMLVIPGGGHGAHPYATRRRRDFFVRHLLGVEPRSRP